MICAPTSDTKKTENKGNETLDLVQINFFFQINASTNENEFCYRLHLAIRETQEFFAGAALRLRCMLAHSQLDLTYILY